MTDEQRVVANKLAKQREYFTHLAPIGETNKTKTICFDLETTGTNINTDRIVEICYLKVYPNGNEEAKTLRINPEMHIPEASSAIHGIYDADVADCPTFRREGLYGYDAQLRQGA